MPFSVHHSLNEMLGEISSHVYDDIQLFTNCTCTDIVYDPNGQLKNFSLQVTVCTWLVMFLEIIFEGIPLYQPPGNLVCL